MTEIIVTDIRKGYYLDSVALMRMSRTIAEIDGVLEAAMMMGTPSNIEIMTDARLLKDVGKTVTGGDLVIGIRATDTITANTALANATAQLDKPSTKERVGEKWRPKTLRAAIKVAPDSNLALISVAGEFAIAEARKAIRRGLNVMIFSDNVSLSDEAELKREAQKLHRIVMGPDCGTAIINGRPLAFANIVSRGSIGIVGASGTGMQEVSSLVAQYGGGISHAIGVGGRDLKSEVGGISTLMAIEALDADPITDKMILISKPPPCEVAAKVIKRISESNKPSVICFIGGEKLSMPKNASQVFTLKDAARVAMGLSSGEAEPAPTIGTSNKGQLIKGLFSGGTLCAEAQVLLRDARQPAYSNVPIPNVSLVTTTTQGHILIDLGDDQYTQGKPHPMIDPTIRSDLMIEAFNDDLVGAVLVDVVIGYGAHPDPAGCLVNVLDQYEGTGRPPIFASVTGTEGDPQVRSWQVRKLKEAGVIVAPTNADAAAWALGFAEANI